MQITQSHQTATEFDGGLLVIGRFEEATPATLKRLSTVPSTAHWVPQQRGCTLRVRPAKPFLLIPSGRRRITSLAGRFR